MKISPRRQPVMGRACKNASTALRFLLFPRTRSLHRGRTGFLSGTRMNLRSVFLTSFVALGCTLPAIGQTSCVAGTTTITGTVYAPNGIDPLPNVTVYPLTTGPLPAFSAGVSCPNPADPLPGDPKIGGTTNTNGTFSIAGVPVSSNLTLVIVSGRWRRQVTIDTSAGSCTTPVAITADLTHFPRNQSEGEIPKFAVATGSVDQVECVLRRVGVQDSEFTNPGGPGRIQLFQGDGSVIDPPPQGQERVSGGAIIDSTTPQETKLMEDPATLNGYDVLMLPCEGGEFPRPNDQLANLLAFANGGGRVYSSHYAYSWLWTNGAFQTAANWTGDKTPTGNSPLDGPATVVTNFAEGRTLSEWLPLVGASISGTNPAQINLSVVRSDISGLPAGSPTQPWLTLNKTSGIMQFVFDTPIGHTNGQCGRVLYNEYHVENPTYVPPNSRSTSAANLPFPTECPDPSSAKMTPQEKLLEYSLFELTDNGGTGSISPTSLDFGDEAVGFTTAAKKVTFTNNSTFVATVSLAATVGDFAVVKNGCQGVLLKSKDTCDITVNFTPTALGARTGFLNVGSGAQTLQATLTGNGTPDLVSTVTTLDLGSVDVGASAKSTFVVTNPNEFAVPIPKLGTSGDFAATSDCGQVAAHGSCSVTVVFTPTVYGPRTGALTPASNSVGYSALSIALTGNGWDYTMGVTPASGTVIAGRSVGTTSILTPLAGFANVVSLKCATSAPGSTCTVATVSFAPSGVTNVGVSIATTAQYAVIGYTGIGQGWFALLGLGLISTVWFRRKQSGMLLRSGLAILLLAGGAFLTGCGDLKPAKNANATLPGSYTYNITAADGVLTHSITYTLNVTAK